jgi:hypothetical protein
MYLTPRKPENSTLEWLCENRMELEVYLYNHTQTETADLLGVSQGYFNSIVTAWASVPGFFPRYRNGQPVEIWLEETREAIEILYRDIFKDNSALTAAYIQIPRNTLRRYIKKWDLCTDVSDEVDEMDYEMETAEVKLRNCLRCGREFASTGNRMCGCAVKEHARYWEI